MEEKLPKCWVCGKDKKPYVVFLQDDIFAFIDYNTARENGDICERCYNYFCMTHEFKEPTDKEIEIAKQAQIFARNMLLWWEKDKKLNLNNNSENYRNFEGTETIAKWFREKEAKKC